MKATDIVFDSNYRMFFSIPQDPKKVTLFLSDSLMAIEEELSEKYKEKIAGFINSSHKWYLNFKNYISDWARKEYSINTEIDTYVLITIFVLFEQSEDEIYGLEFGVDFDEEHNCGIKVRLTEGEFSIFEIGNGDIAFA